jgi:hypothetical protein
MLHAPKQRRPTPSPPWAHPMPRGPWRAPPAGAARRRPSPRTRPPPRTRLAPAGGCPPRTAAPGGASSCWPVGVGRGGAGGWGVRVWGGCWQQHRQGYGGGRGAGPRQCPGTCRTTARAHPPQAPRAHLYRSSGVSVCSSARVAASRRPSSMKGSSATPCQAKRLPFMSTLKVVG